MGTARDLVKAAMRKIGVIAVGENPSAEELQDGLSALNSLLSSLSNENLLIYETPRESFQLVGGKQTYTMGPSGDFVTSRPTSISNILLKDQSGAEYPVRLLSLDEFESISLKSTQSTIPAYAYTETTYPNVSISLWPVPSEERTLIIDSSKPLPLYQTGNATVSLPPGYEQMLIYRLAIDLAPEYGKPVSAEVARSAAEAVANLKRINTRVDYLTSDAADVGSRRYGFNITTGRYR